MPSISQSGAWLFAFISLVGCNYTAHQIAYWDRPRAALIRDNVYVEGGLLQTAVLKNGLWSGNPAIAETGDGLLFKLSMHKSFDIFADGTPAFFETIPEYSVTNFYLDGFMFADYDEFYAWG